MKKNNWHVCIVVPARNEEILLARCLNSLLEARHALPINITVDIVLAVDASTDQSATIGQDILNGYGTVIIIDKKNVGLARKIAADTALKRYGGDLSRCWLANTDADCKVPSTWLVDQLKWADNSIEGVTGTVVVDSYLAHEVGVQTRFLANYMRNIASDHTHPHIHGANIGIRADAYQRAGGWKGLKTAEDHDLWYRLLQLQVPTIADARLTVITSGRRYGRAPNGFATKLARFNQGLV